MVDKATDDRGVSEELVSDAAFDEAFDLAANAGEKAELSPADDPANVKDKEIPIVPAKVEEKVEAKVETPPVETPAIPDPAIQQPGESDEKYEQRYKTLQGIHKHDKETWETERATLLSELEQAKKPPTPAPEKKPETAIPAVLEDSLSEEDKAALKEYDEEFDVVSKMEGKKREVELKKLRKEFEGFVQNLNDELKTEFTTQLAPAVTLVAETQIEREKRGEETHFATIRSGHPDFEKFRDDGSILAWIETKPKYMQKSMAETYSKGEAEDVVDLITDYKNENNIPIIHQASPDTTNVVQMSPEKAKKKLAMTAVTTRRGAVNASMAVANDFEGAFDEAVNKGG